MKTTMSATRLGTIPAEPPKRKSRRRPRCIGCGRAYKPLRPNQARCTANCSRTSARRNQARTIERQGPRRFIAIDGEGVTDPETGEHRYVLLSCGDKHLSNDGAHLGFEEICTFLWACYEECPGVNYVGFYLKYDFSQWLRTIPENRGRALLSAEKIASRRRTAAPHLPPFPVTYHGWDFDYLYGKRFKLRPYRPPAEPQLSWLYINDAGPYFQSSFLKAIDPEGNPNPVCTPEEFALIAAGKKRRSSAEFDPKMVEYNQLECTVLARLMSQLEGGMREEGLKPRRDQWHGPGQLAQMWLGKIGAPKGERVREAVPEPVREAARSAYFGGWFEIFWHGPVPGPSWSYDVNSAYPFIMSRLPCLLHGQWERHVTVNAGDNGRLLTHKEKAALLEGFGLVRARLAGRHSVVGAMQHRLPNRAILRPQQTEGWFWKGELAAAIRAGFIAELRYFESWHYNPCQCPPPLAPIADLYQGRLLIGKNSPAGKARKFIYNACAGKFQQSVGQPAFGNPVYASAITSGCRAMMADCIALHPKGAPALLMVATDGVTFKSRHDGLELDPQKLGAWTETPHENLSLFMPGVYWDDSSRARIAAAKDPVFKSRGIAAKDLARRVAAIDRAWARFGQGRGDWPKLSLPISFALVSPKQALARGKWDLCGTVTTDGNRTVKAAPGHKRRATAPGRSAPWGRPQKGELLSLPYDGLFGDEMREGWDDEFGDHPDGPVATLLTGAMHVR